MFHKRHVRHDIPARHTKVLTRHRVYLAGMSCAAGDSLARRKGLLYNIGFVCLVGFSISLAGMSCVYVMRLHMSCGFVHCLVGLFTVLYVGDMSCAYVLQISSFVYHACMSCMYVMRSYAIVCLVCMSCAYVLHVF